MITFSGTRKTRARGPYDTTTSAPASISAPAPPPAPAPAPPTLIAPSGPSAQSSDILVPMLQSLHHGLCLVM